MSDDEPSVAEAGLMRQKVDNHVDEDTLRIMVSTDNHLGYAEKDPIRGNDSFAAFEEVLVLAKRHNVRFLICFFILYFSFVICTWQLLSHNMIQHLYPFLFIVFTYSAIVYSSRVIYFTKTNHLD